MEVKSERKTAQFAWSQWQKLGGKILGKFLKLLERWSEALEGSRHNGGGGEEVGPCCCLITSS